MLRLLCSLLLRCPCSVHCCHDPFIVRSASNLSTVPWFHSVCAFTINIDNCLLLSLYVLVSPSLHRISVYVTRVSVFTSGLQPRHQIHHGLRQPSSCGGVWDPWSCRIPILQFEQHCSTEAMIGIFPIFAQFFSFLILKSSS